MALLLETPVFTIEAGLRAAEYGVDRLELCADFHEGGVTPSAGALSYLKESLGIPIFVMIRPRGGDFVYRQEELSVMERDIQWLKQLGADGFVFGVLTPYGEVDSEACIRLVEKAGGLPCTFHRAFDAAKDQEKALDKIISCGFSRILTSGGQQSVKEGLNIIQELLLKAQEEIIIMPGGGMKPELVSPLLKTGNLKEIHASAKAWRKSDNKYWNEALALSQNGDKAPDVLTVSQEEVNRFLDVCKRTG